MSPRGDTAVSYAATSRVCDAVVEDVQPTETPTVEDDITHFVCCEADPTEMTLTLCGRVGSGDEHDYFADSVDCARCNALNVRDYCPLRFDHLCPWGDTPAALHKRLTSDEP